MHNAPGHIRRSRTAAAIEAMTVDYSKRSFLQLIPHCAAKTAAGEVHILRTNEQLRDGEKPLLTFDLASDANGSCPFAGASWLRDR